MNFETLDLLVLYGILNNKQFANEFVNSIESNIFSSDLWRFSDFLFNFIKVYKIPPTENVLLEKYCKTNQELQKYVKQVVLNIDSVKTQYNEKEFKFNCEKLKNRFSKNEFLKLKDYLNSVEIESSDVTKLTSTLTKTSHNVKTVNQLKSFESRSLKDHASIFVDEFNAKRNDPNFDAGIKSHYKSMDDATGGFREGELFLVGGESGAGKSLFLNNMAIQMWMQENTIDSTEFTTGQHVIYFSLEMPYKPCFLRVLARLANVPSKKLRNAVLSQEEMARVKKALNFIKKYPYQFHIIDMPRGVTMEVIEHTCEELKVQFDAKVIGIDYLGLIELEKGEGMDDWLKLEKVSEKMHEFARCSKRIVLSAVQLNRMKPTKDLEEKIGLHRIGRSAGIIKNANMAVQIHTRTNEKQFPDMEYFFIKNRDGELSKGRMLKDLACATLIDFVLDDDSMPETDDISSAMAAIDL